MPKLKGKIMKHTFITAYLLILATLAQAQSDKNNPKIAVELNSISQVESGCQLTFLALNGHSEDIDQVVFETVLIDTSGVVMLLTLLDFGSLPSLLSRVRQFIVPQQSCIALGSILINGVITCSALGLDPSVCESGLDVSSRTDVELIG